MRDHALFVAFAPLEQPQIAVAVIIENGESGSTGRGAGGPRGHRNLPEGPAVNVLAASRGARRRHPSPRACCAAFTSTGLLLAGILLVMAIGLLALYSAVGQSSSQLTSSAQRA